MRLTDILEPQHIKLSLSASNKKEVIEELVDVLDADGLLSDRDRVLHAVLEREATRTTGIGNGLAIPHGKCGDVKEIVMAIGRCDPPVDFESIDEQPVSLVLLLVSPMNQTGPHIQALARISRLLSIDAFRKKLMQVESPDQALELIVEYEKAE